MYSHQQELPQVFRFIPSSEQGDQIYVPNQVWKTLTQERERERGRGTNRATDSDMPVFVALQCIGHSNERSVGRICPGAYELESDTCMVPRWIMKMLSPGFDGTELWGELTVVTPITAGRIVLRAHREADVLGMEDPVAELSEALSSEWASLTMGAELTLPCGVFDVMELYDVYGDPVAFSCILNCDVNLEFVPALDHVETVVIDDDADNNKGIEPQKSKYKSDEVSFEPPQQQTKPAAKPTAKPTTKTSRTQTPFVPFSGTGRTLTS